MNKKKRKPMNSDTVLDIVLVTILVVVGCVVAYPLINVLASSFSSADAVTGGRVWLWPVEFNIEGYKAVFRTNDVLIGYGNSLLYTVVGTTINIVMTLLAAYPLSRTDMPGQSFFSLMFTFTMIFSGGMIPNYILMRDLGFLNTIWAMVIPGAISVHNMIITRTFIVNSIPKEMLEAAKIDGADDIQYFFKMVLPLSGSVIAVITLYYAVAHWNAYLNAFMYLSEKKRYPLQIFLRDILISNKVENDMLIDEFGNMATQGLGDLLKYSLIIVAMVPVLLIYPLVQKHFVKGVMVGAVKG